MLSFLFYGFTCFHLSYENLLCPGRICENLLCPGRICATTTLIPDVTTDHQKVCIDEPICPELSRMFQICSDKITAVTTCPQTCKRCGDVLPATSTIKSSNMPSEKMTTLKSMLVSQIAPSKESTACKDLLSRYNQKIICSDKLISKICPLICNAFKIMQSSMNRTDMTTNGGSISDGTTTVSSNMTPITPIPNLVNFTGNSSSNYSSDIQKTYNNTSPATSTTSLPVNTHPHCRDLDPNCPYLQKSIDICSIAEVALGIGCYLTCGYCTSTTTAVTTTVTTKGVQSCVDDNRITYDKTACTTDLKMFCPVTCNLCGASTTTWIRLPATPAVGR